MTLQDERGEAVLLKCIRSVAFVCCSMALYDKSQKKLLNRSF